MAAGFHTNDVPKSIRNADQSLPLANHPLLSAIKPTPISTSVYASASQPLTLMSQPLTPVHQPSQINLSSMSQPLMSTSQPLALLNQPLYNIDINKSTLAFGKSTLNANCYYIVIQSFL